MQTVMAFNTQTGASGRTSADDVVRALEKDEHAIDPVVFFAANSGDPLSFMRGKRYERLGKSRWMSSHFRRATGYGVTHPDREKMQRQGFAMFPHGEKTVLVVDGISNAFTYKQRDLDFSGVKAQYCLDVPTWIARNRGEVKGVHVTSAANAVAAMKAYRDAYSGPPSEFYSYCFASYGGGVAPYSRAFIGWHNAAQIATAGPNLVRIFNDLRKGQNCVLVKSKPEKDANPNRAVGLPVLLHFVPCGTTIDEKGAHGLKGNPVQQKDGRTLFTHLHVDSEIKETAEYEALRRRIVEDGPKGVYVLASPFTDYDPDQKVVKLPEGAHGFDHLGFKISDLALQVA